MEFGHKEPSQLLQEIHLHSQISHRPPHEISVPEGSDDVESESVIFPESGGGVSFQLKDSTRVICWRTHNNVLELFENSLDVDLFSSHYLITFEDSKILPNVHITIDNNHLHIICCTIHAVHDIVLDIPNAGRQTPKPGVPYPSLLSNMQQFDFENDARNCYFGEQIQGQVTNFTAEIVTQSGKAYTAIALKTNQGNMTLVKMSPRTSPVISMINQASRMSRLLSGINPWAEAGGTETILDFKMILLNANAFIVAACNDYKLRIWSFDTHDLILNYDLTNQIMDDVDKTKPVDMKIRVAIGINMLSIYIGADDNAGFVQFKIEIDENTNNVSVDFFSLVSTPLVSQTLPRRHLVDYTISNNHQIAVLWRDIEEIDSMSICATDVGIWHDVASYSSPGLEVPLLPYQDIRESYMDYIFTAGRFSPVALTRTLSVNRRSYSSSMIAIGMQELKEKVAAYIHNEIQEISPEEGADDDALQQSVWRNFYETLVQYQQVVSRSLGLTVSQETSQNLISVIKKGYISVLASVSALEAVCRGSNPEIFEGILRPNECTGDNLKDLEKLLNCLASLHGYLGMELIDSIQQNLCIAGNSPSDVVEEVMPEILNSVREGTGNETLENLICDIDDVASAIKLLLLCLEPTDFEVDFDIPDVQSWPSGSQGVEIISRCAVRHIENRFQLSILLYIISNIFETLQKQNGNIQLEDSTQLPSRVVSYVKTYQAMYWMSTVWVQNISQATLESTMQTLSVHDGSITGIGSERRSVSTRGHKTVLEFFISAEGGKLLQAFLGNQTRNHTLLDSESISKAVNFIAYLMWPLGPTLALPDFLLSHGHYSILQRYLQRELGDWCNWCTKSRAYMLAHCHLHHGNFAKAVQSFISASSGIGTDDYLISKLLKEDEDNLHPVAQEIIYYTKVLPIFERLDLPEQVILLAQHAIEVAKTHEHDPNLPVLWSSIFRQSNNLSRHHEALQAIVFNPDQDHRKDCLRTLAVSLCERKKYKTLIEFQYGELEEDLVNILEHRARGTDFATATHNYYDLLYAFHIQRGNFRKAASAMYEQGYRIGCEFTPSTSSGNIACLEKQLGCYAACINCLHLVDADNRWILHPGGNRGMSSFRQPPGYRSPKRQNDGEIVEHSQRKVIIHEIVDIQKEALLVEMKLKLEESANESMQAVTSPLTTAVEIAGFLCHVGLYDDAITICMKFDLPLTSLFASLASKCVRLSYADDKSMSEGWDWLQENETVKTHCGGGKSSTVKWTAADASYRLLQIYLEKHGDAKMHGSQYYHAVAKSLLGLSAMLPAWFVNAYKSRNSPELLRLLVCFDRIEEATALAIELIEMAKIKIGTDFDEIGGYRRGIWLPYTVIEQLIYVLEDMRSQQEFDDLYYTLNDALEDYQHVAEMTSGDMIQASLQRAAVSAMQS